MILIRCFRRMYRVDLNCFRRVKRSEGGKNTHTHSHSGEGERESVCVHISD